MQAYRVETVIVQNGILTIKGLPLRTGEKIEVIILSQADKAGVVNRYPLQGKPVHYLNPFESVAENDWDALR